MWGGCFWEGGDGEAGGEDIVMGKLVVEILSWDVWGLRRCLDM